MSTTALLLGQYDKSLGRGYEGSLVYYDGYIVGVGASLLSAAYEFGHSVNEQVWGLIVNGNYYSSIDDIDENKDHHDDAFLISGDDDLTDNDIADLMDKYCAEYSYLAINDEVIVYERSKKNIHKVKLTAELVLRLLQGQLEYFLKEEHRGEDDQLVASLKYQIEVFEDMCEAKEKINVELA